MSELAADLLVPVSTPAEDDSQLGSLKVTDAPSTNRVATVHDRPNDVFGLDSRTGTTSATTMCLTGIARVPRLRPRNSPGSDGTICRWSRPPS